MCDDVRIEEGAGITTDHIRTVLEGVSSRADAELLNLSEEAVSAQWYWQWEVRRSAEWNTYTFSRMLEMYKTRCRRWEEHHNGTWCVVERVRDKYVMPRVREFLAELASHDGDLR